MYKHFPNFALRVFHQLHLLNQRSPKMLMSISNDCCAVFSKTIMDCIHVLCQSSASAMFQNDEDFSLWFNKLLVVYKYSTTYGLSIAKVLTQPTIPKSGVCELDRCRALFSKSGR
jgi:hypothetical protein